MQRQQEFEKQHHQKQPYQPHQQQYHGRGRNTCQQQPQFGGNMYQHHQGWLWQTGADHVEQFNVKKLCGTRTIPTPNSNNNYYGNLDNDEKYENDKPFYTDTAPTTSQPVRKHYQATLP